ncbi:aspartate/glutamate racemase family protein [Oceanobacillus chungangensis]|uniref:Aspartate racemase n=1 Tax=Oceanobacillus chungangensis TaxID=1229152 RepID=A0A3D8Q2P5_9BACI|nr:amino acid racemase [Oceanobacillus chungangensis]RDW21789.1 aspartate racemase [Oceanobacillus chungangensis]
MTDKKLGIIGGMGPLATKVFYEKIINHTVAHKDQDHIDTIILSHATLPDRTEAILRGEGQSFIDAVRKDIELLEHAGVANIAIPCNTSHYFYDEMQAMTNINIINMIRDTAEYIYHKHGKGSKVGILATNGTISTGIYEDECKRNELEPFHPNEETQEKVMNIIYNIKADVNYQPVKLDALIHELITKENCACVILGCTELSSVTLSEESKKHSIDPMEILIENAIRLSGKKSKSSLIDEQVYI